MKLDYKKKFKKLYMPKGVPTIINIPEMNYFMIDGKGDPNKSKSYENAITALYTVSYILKMKIVKKENKENDYVVPPLEGLWYTDDMENWSKSSKNDWQWTMMIRIPDFVTEDQINRAIIITKETKNLVVLDILRVEKYLEGLVVQMMHIGAYSEEHSNIITIHDFAKVNGYKLNGKHHEIYISDPRKTEESKLKTVIRQPIN